MRAIDALWARLSASGQQAGALRVDDVHPCDLYATVDAGGRRGLVLVTDVRPPTPPALEAVQVTASRRHDGRFSLAFWLENPALVTPFAHLCQDLIDESRRIDPTSAGGFLLTRLSRWRRLLKDDRTLSLSEARGLMAELVVLDQCLHLWPPAQVIEGWMGPLDAAQDLILPSLRIEVKAIQPDARIVTISSADQLDYTSEMLLAVVTLTTLLAEDMGVSPQGLASTIRGRLTDLGAHSAAALFESRLAAAGVAAIDSEASVNFRIDEIRYFQVGPTFPAIGRPMLPPGVAEIRYDIDLSALLPFSTHLAA